MQCPYCGQTSLTAYQVPHYVHVFWIPVYRLKPMVWFECSHCKRGYDRNDCSPEMLEALESVN